MPRWLIQWHCARQGWVAKTLDDPATVYQLALRLGTSYEATTWTLQRLNIVSDAIGRTLRSTRPRELKAALLRDYRPVDYRGDVWLLTERDGGTKIDGSRNDHFVLRLNEHSGGGYLWNVEELRDSGFAIVRDDCDTTDHEGIGSAVTRSVTATLDEAGSGRLALSEARPWQPEPPLSQLVLSYDFTGPNKKVSPAGAPPTAGCSMSVTRIVDLRDQFGPARDQGIVPPVLPSRRATRTRRCEVSYFLCPANSFSTIRNVGPSAARTTVRRSEGCWRPRREDGQPVGDRVALPKQPFQRIQMNGSRRPRLRLYFAALARVRPVSWTR